MKKRTIAAMLAVLFLLLLLCSCGSDTTTAKKPTDTSDPAVTTEETPGEEPTAISKTEQKGSLFFIKESVSLAVGHEKTPDLTFEEGKEVLFESSDEKILKVNSKGKIKAICEGDAVLTARYADGSESSACNVTVKSALKDTFPTVRIKTASGRSVTSKEYESATISVSGAEKEEQNFEMEIQIKGRGNSTWVPRTWPGDYDSKNSYKIKLSEPMKFLGLGDSKNKDWVLNANKLDVSQMRNRILWDLAERMGNFTYVPDCTWVQLYINDQYRGLYMATEAIEIANDRIAISEDPEKVEQDYLVEADFRGDSGHISYFYVDGYGPSYKRDRPNAIEFVVKNDIGEVTTLRKKVTAYLQEKFEKVNAAINEGEREKIEELIDLSSFLDMYILEEWSMDCDSGRSSFFIVQPLEGKMYFTAPWDYDLGFGTGEISVEPYGLCSINGECCPWFEALLSREWFRKLVLDRMDELKGAFDTVISDVRAQGALLKSAADRNDDLWHVYGNAYHEYVSEEASVNLRDYNAHIEYLIKWATERWQNFYELVKDYEN